mmetsp:Transcript_93507/g.242038  ORF Transcript_93507/g.242038 Transcript_93507/m.242038 type:complete len:972 (+) Transcript_93507:56-2971(+)
MAPSSEIGRSLAESVPSAATVFAAPSEPIKAGRPFRRKNLGAPLRLPEGLESLRGGHSLTSPRPCSISPSPIGHPHFTRDGASFSISLPPTPRPPSPSSRFHQRNAGHYKPWHWRQMDLSGTTKLESLHSMVFPKDRGGIDMDEQGEPPRSQAVSAAIAELMAAVVNHERLMQDDQSSLPSGVIGAGRAGRAAARSRLAAQQSRQAELAAAVAAVDAGGSCGSDAAATLSLARGRRLQQLQLAHESLLSAQREQEEAMKQQRTEEDRVRRQWAATKIQALCRGKRARRVVAVMILERDRPEKEELARLQRALRAPRPARSVWGFEAELRGAEEAAAALAAEEEARLKRESEALVEQAEARLRNANSITLRVAIDGIDPEQLLELEEVDNGIHDNVQEAIEHSVALEAQHGVLAEDVRIHGEWAESLGDIQIVLTPPVGTSVEEVMQALRSYQSLEMRIAGEISVCDGLEEFVVSDVNVEVLDVSPSTTSWVPRQPSCLEESDDNGKPSAFAMLGDFGFDIDRNLSLAALDSLRGSPLGDEGFEDDDSLSEGQIASLSGGGGSRCMGGAGEGDNTLPLHDTQDIVSREVVSPPVAEHDPPCSSNEQVVASAAATPQPTHKVHSGDETLSASVEHLAMLAHIMGAAATEWKVQEEAGLTDEEKESQRLAGHIPHHSDRWKTTRPKNEEPLPSIRLSFEEEAAASLRRIFDELRQRAWTPSSGEGHTSTGEFVTERYIHSCREWQVKPNSQALVRFGSAEAIGCRSSPANGYDFSTCHLGDRGAICVLHALAHDPRCSSLSLAACGLRRASAPSIGVFIEMHPGLSHLDLSQNNLSYDSGESLLEGLRKRAGDEKPTAEAATDMRGSRRLTTKEVFQARAAVSVNLGGTALAWDRAGLTVGPPAGSLWTSHGFRSARFAPSGYEKLRGQLDETQRVVYERPRSRTPSPSTPRTKKKKPACQRQGAAAYAFLSGS